MASQKLPKGWEMELYCIAHRSPGDAYLEKKDRVFSDDRRGKLDKILYGYGEGGIAVPSEDEIKMLGWRYKLYPNTIGDWGNTNQWFKDKGHFGKEYDLYLFTHDDNLIIHNRVIADAIEDDNFKKWGVCANTVGMPPGHLRGSFEFFKPSVLEKMGWKFDLSLVSLTREGKTTATTDRAELDDWNNTVFPLMDFLHKNKVKIGFLSPAYRVSAYVIEGERGFISCTHGANTAQEDAGLDFLEANKVI